jgi:hypothetical protein
VNVTAASQQHEDTGHCGKKVRPDQVDKMGLNLYQNAGDGWALRSDP